jgi:hypothetical protein
LKKRYEALGDTPDEDKENASPGDVSSREWDNSGEPSHSSTPTKIIPFRAALRAVGENSAGPESKPSDEESPKRRLPFGQHLLTKHVSRQSDAADS